jgi:diguanylate cyclase (GGDEF)-like protein
MKEIFRGGEEDLARQLVSIVAEPIHIPERLAEKFPLLNENPIKVTASIGVARASGSESLRDIMQKADMAMYQCKNMGRNCYSFFTDPVLQ